MSGNDMKVKLEVLKDWVGNDSLTRQDMQNVIDEAIKVLEENQKYHAIGTVEECTEAVENIEYFYRLGRTNAIEEFAKQLKEDLDKKFSFGIENKFKLYNSIDEIAKQIEGITTSHLEDELLQKNKILRKAIYKAGEDIGEILRQLEMNTIISYKHFEFPLQSIQDELVGVIEDSDSLQRKG